MYEVDIIFDGNTNLKMRTVHNKNFIVLIEDVEKFIKKHEFHKPVVLCARFFLDNQIIDIKQKIIETLKARRNFGQ